MSAQQSLLELFEGRGVIDRALDPAIENPKSKIQNPKANPFRKQFGECAAGCQNETPATELRVFWCHRCKRHFCWSCFTSHNDS